MDNLVEFDMDDTGYGDSPTVLFGQNDVFNNVAGYNFSSVRYRVRGYYSEAQDVYLAGIKMNDAITGYSPFSLWSGLNEAMRSKETVNGAEMSDFGFGGYNGLTNIPANASNVRKGWRASVMTNSSLYRLRLMLTYASRSPGQRMELRLQRFCKTGRKRLDQRSVLPLLRLLPRGGEELKTPQAGAPPWYSGTARSPERFYPGGVRPDGGQHVQLQLGVQNGKGCNASVEGLMSLSQY